MNIVVQEHIVLNKAVPVSRLVKQIPDRASVRTLLRKNRGIIQNVFRGLPVHRLGRADTVRIVGIAYAVAALRESGKPPAVLPCHRHAVAVGEGIADFVIGDGLPVVRGEQILPQRALIAPCVGFAVSGTGQDVSAVVVGVGFSNAVPCLRRQLVQRVVGVAPFYLVVLADLRDAAHLIIGVLGNNAVLCHSVEQRSGFARICPLKVGILGDDIAGTACVKRAGVLDFIPY